MLTDREAIIKLIKFCGIRKDLSTIRKTIADRDWITHDISVANTLIRSYAKCGAIIEARGVLDQLLEPNIVSWTALISGYVDQGDGQEALACFREMKHCGLLPDSVAYFCSLKACAVVGAIKIVKEIHALVIEQGLLQTDIVLGTTLVNVYAKCGYVKEAREAFDQLAERNVESWNALIAGYTDQGFAEEALTCFREMENDKVKPNSLTYLSLLRACAILGALEMVEEIHAQMRDRGLLNKYIVLGTTLVNAYAKCGSLMKSQEVFDHLVERDVVSWGALIAGYVDWGFGREALKCFSEMVNDDLTPNSIIYVSCLKACAIIGAVKNVEEIHAQLRQQGLLKRNITVGNALVSAYAKCGAVKEAQKVFDQLAERNIVSWSALISGYVDLGFAEEALRCFQEMENDGVIPDSVAYVCSLKACAVLGTLEIVKEIHAQVRQHRLLDKDLVLGTTLVNAYARCGAMREAQEVFNVLSVRDVVSWGALISGYTDQGFLEEALACFMDMEKDGVIPNSVIYVSTLKACTVLGALEVVEFIHAQLREQGLLNKDIILGTTLVNAYAKCGALEEAQSVFDLLTKRDVVSWNALIGGYADQGFGELALKCFREMQSDGVTPNSVTYVSTLQASSILRALEIVEEIHGKVIQQGLLKKDIAIGNALVASYAECGAMKEAREVFDQLPERNIISWSVLITGYVGQGFSEEALSCFREMPSAKVSPNAVAYICTLKACAVVGALQIVEEIYSKVKEQGLLDKDIVLGTSLVNAYVKCGAVKEAREVFDQLTERDVVTWTTLISGYVDHEFAEEALRCFWEMQRDRVSPNAVAYMCSLRACTIAGALQIVEEIHDQVREQGLLNKDIVLGTTLINAYAKFGALKEAQQIFDKLADRNVASWNALLAGYAQLGQVNEMLELLNRMMAGGLSPDSVTFLVLLNGCSHAALLEEGEKLFDMIAAHGLSLTAEHYTCIVDMFSRAGWFDRAKCFLLDHVPTLLTFLGACQKWLNVDLGRRAFDKILQLDKKCVSAYVCMANIYAATGMMKEADEIEILRAEEESKKPLMPLVGLC